MSNAIKRISSRFSFLLALGALLTWVAFVPADVWANAGPGMERGHNYEHGKGRHDFVGKALHGLLRNQKELGLSKEQSNKIKTIATDYAKSRIQETADVKLAELDVRTRIFDEKTELSSIEAALRKSEGARTALRLDGVKALRAATAILTTEQREKWHQSSMDKHEGAKEWKGHKGRDKGKDNEKDY